MTETALVFSNRGEIIRFHLPPGRTRASIPDSRDLWDIMWQYRRMLGGVAHVHPWEGHASPSGIDTSTWRACEQGLGTLLLWPIATFSEVRCFVWNAVTGEYTEAGPLTHKIHGINRLIEMAREGR